MTKRFLQAAFTVSFAALIAVAWLQQDALFDAWRLRGYSPPAEVSRLADVTTMTNNSRRLFYVYKPQLEDKSSFNSHCTGAEQTIVLGCYIKHRGIYLYSVPDPRLNGVVEVTAAHELLHAEYDRLSTGERQRIDKLTAEYAATIKDTRLNETIENYRKKDPNVVPNELHSILATEVKDLPDELEQHYSRYFTNRQKIVELADTYKQAFTAREAEVAAIDSQLASLKNQIDSLNASLEAQQASLKAQFEQLQQAKRSENNEAYNEGVPAYNQSVARYNADVKFQRSLVAQYNELVERRNSLAVEENELIKALDSRETIESQ